MVALIELAARPNEQSTEFGHSGFGYPGVPRSETRPVDRR